MSYCETKKNKIALEYSIEKAKDIKSISDFFIHPLGLTTFGYKRVYLNGQYLFLSTNENWLQYHYQNVNDHGTFFQEAMDTAHLNHSYKVLWPSTSQDHFLQALNHFGMWHGINFYKWREDYLELWTFSTSYDRGGISQIYINTLTHFENFINHFNLKANEIININDQEKLAQFENKSHNSSQQHDISSNSLLQIIEQIRIDEIMVNGSNGIVSLTKRESECLKLLGTGKSVKEIANILEISPRTVESYINLAKEKTGYSKSKLLNIIQSAAA